MSLTVLCVELESFQRLRPIRVIYALEERSEPAVGPPVVAPVHLLTLGLLLRDPRVVQSVHPTRLLLKTVVIAQFALVEACVTQRDHW
jgi:hypothetical protein